MPHAASASCRSRDRASIGSGGRAAGGPALDGWYGCPHHPDATLSEYRLACDCRKPAPGLIERAFAEWGFDRARSVMIGDTENDMRAAAAAGIPGMRFSGGSLLDCVEHTMATRREDNQP